MNATGDVGQSKVQRGWIALELLGDVISGNDPGMDMDGDQRRLAHELPEQAWAARERDTEIGWRIIARDRAGAQTIEDHLTVGTPGSPDEVLDDGVLVDGKNPTLSYPAGMTGDFRLANRTGDSWRAGRCGRRPLALGRQR